MIMYEYISICMEKDITGKMRQKKPVIEKTRVENRKFQFSLPGSSGLVDCSARSSSDTQTRIQVLIAGEAQPDRVEWCAVKR